MRANSLALRLFLAATAWTVAILLVTGFVLSSVYRQSVERAFDRRLGVYLKTLIAELASPDETTEKLGQSMGEPLFELPLSGWYWQVTRLGTGSPDVKASRSLWDASLPHLEDLGVPAALGGLRQAYALGPEEQRLRIAERTVDLGEEGRFLVSVAGAGSEIDEELHAFDRAILVTFAILAAVLLLTTLFQVRFGLAPLKRISESLAAIRSGAAERLAGTFPDEIAPLARETNALIEANREIVERARTHVGNLAHALKTPLSVIVNEASGRTGDPLAEKVREQADIMRDQVTRHLERARLAARYATVGSLTDVAPVVTALARTMEKIHHDRGITIEVDIPADARFRGERQDLEEMVGNLVDNACKWAKARVGIAILPPDENDAAPAAASSVEDERMLRIVVEDDGAGLNEQQRGEVGNRGRRLDETKPGSGLGLSIVMELTRLYGGELKLGTSPMGGLRAELVLPGG
jgi:signal transduction histidine kinase